MTDEKKGRRRNRIHVSRRSALRIIGSAGIAAGVVAAAAGSLLPKTTLAAPAVRKKVRLAFWAYSDNPSHQQKLVDAVNHFNGGQNFVTVEMDATSRTQELHQKVAVAYASGAAPDIAAAPHYNIQQYYKNGVLYPIEEFFQKWDQKSDYFPYILEAMRGVPKQPALYLPTRLLCFILWYRADWFEEAKLDPPKTYDEFLAAARAVTKAPNRYGYALRGGDYYGVQIFEPVWGSAGVKFVDESGKVDFDSPQAVEIAEKFVRMFTKDKSVQPTAVSDKYPQLFALMEQGRCGMWIYGTHASPQLTAKLGARIQAVPTPQVKKPCTEITPAGHFIVSTSKEKEAAWEFLMSIGSAPSTVALGPQRGYLPVRKSIAAYPEVRDNPHMKVGSDQADNWWMPPMSWKHFQNYQDKIAPYWQEALREKISPKELMVMAAKMLRGEA